MKIIVQRHAILLAALLQILPIVRNFFVNPAAGSAMAFILRWGVGASAAIGTVDAVSGATTANFSSPNTFTGQVGVAFTNNLTVNGAKSDPGANTIITSNSVAVLLSKNGQTTNFDMPPGLSLRYVDNGNTPVYDSIFGTPTQAGTNKITISMNYPPAGAVASTNITIIITPAVSAVPPTITNQPVSITNLIGSNPSFSVIAGPPPLTYQWFFNSNSAVAAGTGATLTLTNAQLSQAGFYSVVVSDSGGSVTSPPARLTLWQSPVITNQPVGVTNLAGGPATFSTVAGGLPAVSYQWTFNGTPLASAVSPTFTIANIRLNQAGAYSVIVTNMAGSVTSAPALLAVTLPPTPVITPTAIAAATPGTFQFTFSPVVGLTNTVQTSGNLSGGSWGTLTNIAPPATTNAVTVSDALNGSNAFYRVQIIP
jgi:hypothetical protein